MGSTRVPTLQESIDSITIASLARILPDQCSGSKVREGKSTYINIVGNAEVRRWGRGDGIAIGVGVGIGIVHGITRYIYVMDYLMLPCSIMTGS